MADKKWAVRISPAEYVLLNVVVFAAAFAVGFYLVRH